MSLIDWLIIGTFVLIAIACFFMVAMSQVAIVSGWVSALGAHRRSNDPGSPDQPPALPPPR